MPKKEVVELPPMLGRPGNHVSAGLVGLPNVGKSTTFNVLCSQNVAAENFPFCTIDPSTARVKVPDERFEVLCEKYQPASKVPAWLTVVDSARRPPLGRRRVWGRAARRARQLTRPPARTTPVARAARARAAQSPGW